MAHNKNNKNNNNKSTNKNHHSTSILMRHLCLTRCFLAYTVLCGLSLIAVALYDVSTTNVAVSAMVLPQPLLDFSRLVLPERLSISSFCNIQELFNESEKPQVVVIPRRPSLETQQEQQPKSTHQQQEQQVVAWGAVASAFDPNRSTEENYTASSSSTSSSSSNTNNNNNSLLVGRFAAFRRQLDYSYHSVYTAKRQELQDTILSGLLEKAKQGQKDLCGDDDGDDDDAEEIQRWAVFTAGVMGAGKTHTIELLSHKKRFPLQSFVWVDPDQIRHCLPEFDYLVRYNAAQAGDRTRKEAGMLSEILTLAALEQGQSVLVDGSLRDVAWYQAYFDELRNKYPGIKIAILHVTAPRQAVLERAAVRTTSAGVVVVVFVFVWQSRSHCVVCITHGLLRFAFCCYYPEPRAYYRPCRAHFLVGRNHGPSAQISGNLENQG